MKKDDLRNMVELAGDSLGEVVGPLPDGSGFATSSFSLPAGHWSTEEGVNVPPMPFRCGTRLGELRSNLVDEVQAAARYAVRTATLNGSENDFDPDAMVQNFVVGMVGYYTADGLSSDSCCNPDPVPTGFMTVVRGAVRESDELLRDLFSKTSGAYYGQMLRLAVALEVLTDTRLEDFKDLWDFLNDYGFSQSFIDDVAKPCWQAAIAIVTDLPYRLEVTRTGHQSERRLTTHLLREVCELMRKNGGGAS